ncbi:MAG: type II 3-dehydroquinate dehydratase [Halanaerobiales bacterium]|nr:type II 3-dehydroquinate dehydratase [Halanaerobiales bacterium]
MDEIAIINGPNLNMLGVRDQIVYGKKSLSDINHELMVIAEKNGISINFFQSNHAGEIIDYIQNNYNKWDGLIINPAGLTHSSIVLRDVLEILNIPIIEVHISNIYKRESFRQKSLISGIVKGKITGLGDFGYKAALYYLIKVFKEER